MGEYVFRVARDGYDVNTCDTRFLTLDSTKNQFKVQKQGSGTLTIPSGTSNQFLSGVKIEHGLSYQPQVIVWIQDPDTEDWIQSPCEFKDTSNSIVGLVTDARGDGEYVIWAYNYDTPTGSPHTEGTLNYEYLIFVEPVKDVWS